jgi:hypothetical protein
MKIRPAKKLLGLTYEKLLVVIELIDEFTRREEEKSGLLVVTGEIREGNSVLLFVVGL